MSEATRYPLNIRAAGLLALSAAMAMASAGAAHAVTGPAAPSYVLTIGTDGPVTSPLKVTVDGINKSVQLAAMLANQKHLLPNVTFRVDPRDDTVGNNYSADKAAANARAFIADPTDIGEIGPDNSGAAEVTMPIFNNASLVSISPATTLAILTDPANVSKFQPLTAAGKGPRTYFRTINGDAVKGRAAALFAARVAHYKTVYVTDNKDAYGTGLASQFKQNAQKIGLNVLGSNELEPNQPQMGARSLATVIKNTTGGNVDLVYFGGETGSQGGAEFLAAALKRVGLTHTAFMGADGIFDPSYITSATPAVANGTYTTINGYPPTAKVPVPPVARDFARAFTKQYPGVGLQGYNDQAYDAANLIIQATVNAVKARTFKLGATGGATLQANRAAIARQVAAFRNYPGTTGPITFDRNGDTSVHAIISVYQVVNGQWKFIRYAPEYAPE